MKTHFILLCLLFFVSLNPGGGASRPYNQADQDDLQTLESSLKERRNMGRGLSDEVKNEEDLVMFRVEHDKVDEKNSRKKGRTPLHFAAMDANEKLVDKFLKDPQKYGKVTDLDKAGLDPLMSCLAVCYPDEENCENPYSYHKGHVGNRKENQEKVALRLIEANANVNLTITPKHKSPLRATPLMQAISQELLQVISALIKAGADVHKCDEKGWFPLALIANGTVSSIPSGPKEKCKILIEEMVRILIEEGKADPNFASQKKGTALENGSLCGNYYHVWSLLQHGAEITESVNQKQPWIKEFLDKGIIERCCTEKE